MSYQITPRPVEHGRRTLRWGEIENTPFPVCCFLYAFTIFLSAAPGNPAIDNKNMRTRPHDLRKHPGPETITNKDRGLGPGMPPPIISLPTSTFDRSLTSLTPTELRTIDFKHVGRFLALTTLWKLMMRKTMKDVNLKLVSCEGTKICLDL